MSSLHIESPLKNDGWHFNNRSGVVSLKYWDLVMQLAFTPTVKIQSNLRKVEAMKAHEEPIRKMMRLVIGFHRNARLSFT